MRSLALFSASMGCQYGGTETYVRTLAEKLSASVEDLRLVTGGSEANLTSDYRFLLQDKKITGCCFPMLDRHSLPGRLLARSWLGKKISPMDLESLSALFFRRRIEDCVGDCDLLEAHYPLDGLLFPFLPSRMKKILHFHGAWPPPLFRKCWKRILTYTDCCIACSFYARDELLKVMPNAVIEVVHNGVDTTVFSNGGSGFGSGWSCNPGRLKIGTVARLSRDKGVDLLCLAARELADEVELFLAGPVDTGFAGELTNLADFPNIHLLGPVSHKTIPDFYRFLDCFILPSRFEAFPLTILEAMASGCAVVATNVGGIPEMLGSEEEAGLLFESGDASALKAHIHRLWTDRDGCRRLGKLGRSRVVEHFSLEKTVASAQAVYERTLASRKR